MDVELLTRIVFDWGVRCFGHDHMYDPKVRALRAAEEMIELGQALNVDKAKLHLLIDVVYSRPKGKVHQEFGGVMVTLLALAWCVQVRVSSVTQIEVLRCLSKTPEHFAKRNRDKIEQGLS